MRVRETQEARERREAARLLDVIGQRDERGTRLQNVLVRAYYERQEAMETAARRSAT